MPRFRRWLGDDHRRRGHFGMRLRSVRLGLRSVLSLQRVDLPLLGLDLLLQSSDFPHEIFRGHGFRSGGRSQHQARREGERERPRRAVSAAVGPGETLPPAQSPMWRDPRAAFAGDRASERPCHPNPPPRFLDRRRVIIRRSAPAMNARSGRSKPSVQPSIP